MSSELATNDVNEADDKSVGAADPAPSVARCQITVLSEAASLSRVPHGRNSETAVIEQRDSAVSVHRTLVLQPSKLAREPAEEPPRRSASRKATLAFDFAALQAAEREVPPENLTSSSTRLRAVRALAADPVLPASERAPAVRMLTVLAAIKTIKGRLALTAFLVTLLCTFLATAFLVGGDAGQPEQPRLLHLVTPRPAASPAASTPDLDWAPQESSEERGRVE